MLKFLPQKFFSLVLTLTITDMTHPMVQMELKYFKWLQICADLESRIMVQEWGLSLSAC